MLYWADRIGEEAKSGEDWTLKDALVMGGLWQVLAPRSRNLALRHSRSPAARQLGYRRDEAARLAMLMSIPTILASGVLLGGEVVATADAAGGPHATGPSPPPSPFSRPLPRSGE